jgi:hypothetical protein
LTGHTNELAVALRRILKLQKLVMRCCGLTAQNVKIIFPNHPTQSELQFLDMSDNGSSLGDEGIIDILKHIISFDNSINAFINVKQFWFSSAPTVQQKL